MKWIIEHFQIIVAIAAAIAYWLNQRRQAAAEEEQQSPRQAADAEQQAERTRRVQEEIRRKIAERRGEVAAETPTAARELLPPPVPPPHVPPVDPFGGPMRRIARSLEERLSPPPSPFEPDAEAKEALARQAQLAEQMRALEAARQAEQQRAAELAARAAEMLPKLLDQPVRRGAGEVQEALRDPAAIRRAIVLREILGAPVALR